jgi:NAD(P)H-dependent FMN reductase
MNAQTLVLIGSPKGKASTSHMIGSYLSRKLEAGGMPTEEMIVGEALGSAEKTAHLLEAMNTARMIIVSFPLYVDQLPAPLIQAFDLVAGNRASGIPAGQKIMAVVQCGFPETAQNQAVLEVMRRFAAKAGYAWAGGLAMGMGGAIGRKPLEKAGGMVRNVVKALDMTVASILAGGGVPEEAARLMGKPLIPRWLYLILANFGMKSEARKHGVISKLFARPYESAD